MQAWLSIDESLLLPSWSSLHPPWRQSLGEDSVLTENAQLDAYTADTYWPAITPGRRGCRSAGRRWSPCRGARKTWPPRCGSRPKHQVPVVAWGGGSGTQGGAVPISGGLVLDLRGLDTIIEIDEVSMTVTAQAGVNGDVLERALNERGLMFPHYRQLAVGDRRRLHLRPGLGACSPRATARSRT